MREQEDGLDEYQGIPWTERAGLGQLRAAIDPADKVGRRNRLIDRTQRIALRWGFARARRLVGHGFHRGVDFGCGGGRLTDELEAVVNEAWGLDRNQAMVDLARKHVSAPDRILVWPDGAETIPDRSFDLLMTIMVTLTPTMLEATTRAISRLLSPDGVAVMVEQVDRRRELTLADYERSLTGIGLRIHATRLVRRGNRSPFMALASRLPLPARALGLLAEMEWRVAPRLGIPMDGYGDVVIVARRTADSNR